MRIARLMIAAAALLAAATITPALAEAGMVCQRVENFVYGN